MGVIRTGIRSKTSGFGTSTHTATERYQERGFDEDGYAQATDRYSSFATALRCLLEDCGFEPEAGSQQSLFSS